MQHINNSSRELTINREIIYKVETAPTKLASPSLSWSFFLSSPAIWFSVHLSDYLSINHKNDDENYPISPIFILSNFQRLCYYSIPVQVKVWNQNSIHFIFFLLWWLPLGVTIGVLGLLQQYVLVWAIQVMLTHTHTHTLKHTHWHIHWHKHTHIDIYIDTHTHIHWHTLTLTQTYIDTQTHTHTHTHTHPE